MSSASVPPASSQGVRHSMQANKSKNTGPELKVRAALRAAGLTGYRIHYKRAPGRPDICFVGRRVAIFVHGCYWHRCPHCALPLPRSHTSFWAEKFARNRARDARDNALLVAAGWTVVVVWECQLAKGRLDTTMAAVIAEVRAAEGRERPPRVVTPGSPAARRHVLARRRLRRP